MASSSVARRPATITNRLEANSSGRSPKTRNASRFWTRLTRRKIAATLEIPGVARSFASSDSGRSDLVRSDAPDWKTPKSARPTWIRSLAVRRTPAAIESSATISATPIATPAAVRPVRTARRMRFRQTSPGQVTVPIKPLWRELSQFCCTSGTVSCVFSRYARRGWRVVLFPTQGGEMRVPRSDWACPSGDVLLVQSQVRSERDGAVARRDLAGARAGRRPRAAAARDRSRHGARDRDRRRATSRSRSRSRSPAARCERASRIRSRGTSAPSPEWRARPSPSTSCPPRRKRR